MVCTLDAVLYRAPCTNGESANKFFKVNRVILVDVEKGEESSSHLGE